MLPFDSTRLVTIGPDKNTIPINYPVSPDSKYPAMTFSNLSGSSFTVKMTPQTAYPFKLSLQPGQYYCIRHMYYDMIAFKIHNSSDLLFDGVTIYGMPGMGWLVNTKTHHLKLSNCAIARRPGGRTPLTTAADGFHVNESQGNLEINSCTFTGAGDDVINIHTNCWQGTFDFGLSDSDTLHFKYLPSTKLRLAAGDVLEFYKPDYSPYTPPIQLTVASTPVYNSDGSADVTFTTPWPNIPNLSIVRNLTYNNSNVRVVGTSITYTNGRGILLSADNATVSSCYLRNIWSTPLQFHTEIVDNLWAEGHGANNVVVASNTFENCNAHGRWDGALIYTGALLPWGTTSCPLFQKLLLENNRFFNCPGPAMSFNSSQNVIARNNTMEFSGVSTNPTRYSGSLFAANASSLALGGNTWHYSANVTYGNPAVVTDPASTSDVRPNTNLLIPF